MSEICKILALTKHPVQCPEWQQEAERFCIVAGTQINNNIVLCTDYEGVPQSWRNMSFRSRERYHELRLPPTGIVEVTA